MNDLQVGTKLLVTQECLQNIEEALLEAFYGDSPNASGRTWGNFPTGWTQWKTGETVIINRVSHGDYYCSRESEPCGYYFYADEVRKMLKGDS